MTEVEKRIVLLNEELQKVERKKFMNNMVDHWTDENYSIDRECFNEIQRIKKELEELENE